MDPTYFRMFAIVSVGATGFSLTLAVFVVTWLTKAQRIATELDHRCAELQVVADELRNRSAELSVAKIANDRLARELMRQRASSGPSGKLFILPPKNNAS